MNANEFIFKITIFFKLISKITNISKKLQE